MLKNLKQKTDLKRIARSGSFKKLVMASSLFLLVLGVSFIKMVPMADAECSPPSTTYGTDTISVNVTSAATYTIWTRMEIPSASSDSIMLQVDNNECYNVGGNSSLGTGAWKWVDYQNGATTTPIQLALSAGTHSFEYIGTSPGVDVDVVLLLSDSCTPGSNTTGTNCETVSVPSTPTAVKATAPTPTSVDLTWGASTDSGGPGLGGYYILRNGSQIASVGANTTTYTDNGVSPSTSYSYTVEAYDTASPPNVSPASSPAATVTTPKATVSAPTPPTLTDSSTTSSQTTLSWSGAADKNGPGLGGYNILENGTKIASVAANISTYNVTDLSPSTSYTFTVVAYDTSSPPLSSVPSNAEVVKTLAAPATAPTAPSELKASNTTSMQTTLTWGASSDTNGPGLGGYNILENGTKVASVGPSTLTYTVTGLSATTSYNFTVDAFDTSSPALTSPVSNTASVTTLATPPPSTPTLSGSATSDSQINLSWSASTDNGGPGLGGYYIIENGVTITNVSNTTTSYDVTGLAANTSYSFIVEAYDTSNPPVVANSNTETITTLTNPDNTPPTAPTNLVASAVSDSQINLTWSASSSNAGVEGYNVYQSKNSDGSGATEIATTKATSYGNTGLTANTTYYYYVVAYNSYGNSKPSGTANATTQGSTTVTYTTVVGRVINTRYVPLAGVQVHTGPYGTTHGAAQSTTNAQGFYMLCGLISDKSHWYVYNDKGYHQRIIIRYFNAGTHTLNAALKPIE